MVRTMAQRARKLIKRRMLYPLKEVVKPLFKNHVYVAHHGFIKGFKITGNLGFLRKPSLTYKHRFLMHLDLAGQIVYDVGAHIGITTLFFSRAVGETGQVIGFEPSPETFVVLRKNVEMNGLANVTLVNVGLGEQPDTLPLVLAFGESNSALATMDKTRQVSLLNDQRGIATKTVLVQVYPLDEYILTNPLPDPDFINIDVEGYEYQVLLGMQETLRRRKPSLLVEIHGAGQGRKLENCRKVVKLLVSHDYEIQEIISRLRIVESNAELALKGRFLFCR